MKFKYLIIEKSGDPRAILFSQFIDHAFMRNSIHAFYPGVPVISAGFCRVIDGKWNCFGKSIGLNMVSRGVVDEEIIQGDYEFEL